MDKFTTLLEKATDADKVELKIHKNALVACLKSYNDEYSVARGKDLKMAREGLKDLIETLWPKYSPPEKVPVIQEDSFATRKDALDYLEAEKFKIKKSKFYGDCKPKTNKKGDVIRPALVRMQQDGTITKNDLIFYAQSLDLKNDPTEEAGKRHIQKLEGEIRRINLQNALLQMEKDVKEGKVILREEAELSRANAEISIFSALNNTVSTKTPDWIELVDGDQAKTPLLIAAFIDILDDTRNALARPGFAVTLCQACTKQIIDQLK
jgi:hypothetical protein